MPDAGWVNDIHVAKCASITCGLGKQFAFDVIDNNASLPGEELAGCQEPLTASGWRNNQQIAKLTAGLSWPDTEKVRRVFAAHEQAIRRRVGTHQMGKL